jgi:cytosine/adenosine deaminase-related metal-dependent hydrolase
VRGLDEALATAAALRAAGRVGIAELLAGGPATPSEVASACGISERGARTIMAALASMGLVDTTADGLYRALPLLGPLLAYAALWDRFPEAVIAGGPAAG